MDITFTIKLTKRKMKELRADLEYMILYEAADLLQDSAGKQYVEDVDVQVILPKKVLKAAVDDAWPEYCEDVIRSIQKNTQDDLQYFEMAETANRSKPRQIARSLITANNLKVSIADKVQKEALAKTTEAAFDLGYELTPIEW